MRRGIVFVFTLIPLALLASGSGGPAPGTDPELQKKELLARITVMIAVIAYQAYMMADCEQNPASFIKDCQNGPCLDDSLWET